MSNILSKTGILSNQTIQTWHVTQSIDAFTGVEAYDITISGSLNIDGPLNLDSPVTGTLITNASYSVSSSYSLTSLSSSNSQYATVSYDILTIQLNHGSFNPTQNTTYYFDIYPSSPTTTVDLKTSPTRVGMYPPYEISILSASISTTVNEVLGTEQTSSYTLYTGVGENIFTNTLTHDVGFSSFVESVNPSITVPTNRKICIKWETPPIWSTPPEGVCHNIVLYCTRNYNA